MLRYFLNRFQLLSVLSRFHISLPESSKLRFLSNIAEQNAQGVVEAIRNHRTIKCTVDNIDGQMVANQAST